MPYPVVSVRSEEIVDIEEMGSKPKFWYTDAKLGRCLYKLSRPGTGEDWAERFPRASRIWLERLSKVSEQNTLDLLRSIPSGRISPVAIDFAQSMLTMNRRRLLGLREVLR